MDPEELTVPVKIGNPYTQRLFQILEQGGQLQRWQKIPALSGFCSATVSSGFKKGRLPGIKILGCWVTDQEVILDFLKNNQPSSKCSQEPRISLVARRKQIKAASERSRLALRLTGRSGPKRKNPPPPSKPSVEPGV